MIKSECWDLYNMETCIPAEPAHLIPGYIESQHSHKAFSSLSKVRDGVKQSKRNIVIGKFLDSGTHIAVDPFPPLLAWRTTQSGGFRWSLGEEGWEKKKTMEQKSPSHKTAAIRNIWLCFSFYLYPFNVMELFLTYWIYYWLPQE